MLGSGKVVIFPDMKLSPEKGVCSGLWWICILTSSEAGTRVCPQESGRVVRKRKSRGGVSFKVSVFIPCDTQGSLPATSSVTLGNYSVSAPDSSSMIPQAKQCPPWRRVVRIKGGNFMKQGLCTFQGTDFSHQGHREWVVGRNRVWWPLSGEGGGLPSSPRGGAAHFQLLERGGTCLPLPPGAWLQSRPHNGCRDI